MSARTSSNQEPSKPGHGCTEPLKRWNTTELESRKQPEGIKPEQHTTILTEQKTKLYAQNKSIDPGGKKMPREKK